MYIQDTDSSTSSSTTPTSFGGWQPSCPLLDSFYFNSTPSDSSTRSQIRMALRRAPQPPTRRLRYFRVRQGFTIGFLLDSPSSTPTPKLRRIPDALGDY